MMNVLTYLQETTIAKWASEARHESLAVFGIQPLALQTYAASLQRGGHTVLLASSLYQAQRIYESFGDDYDNIHLFAADEFISAQLLASSPELLIERVLTLAQLVDCSGPQLVITHVAGICKHIVSPEQFKAYSMQLKTGIELAPETIIRQLVEAGYKRESLVLEAGTFAVRGGIIDIFALNHDDPIRIEFFGDEIDSLRFFDRENQRSKNEIDAVTVIPFVDYINETTTASIVEYLPDAHVVFYEYPKVQQTFEHMLTDAESLLEEHKALPFTDLDVVTAKNGHSYLAVSMHDLPSGVSVRQAHVRNYDDYRSIDYNFDIIIGELQKKLESGWRIIYTSANNEIIPFFTENEYTFVTDGQQLQPGVISIIESDNHHSESFEEDKLYVVAHELFEARASTKKKKKHTPIMRDYGQVIERLEELSKGDYIVHEQHGIGRYLGITTLETNGGMQDYLDIEYADNGKLYIPVNKIHLIQKYVGSEAVVPKLNKLGSNQWQKQRAKVSANMNDIADKLLQLYAERERTPGFAFGPDTPEQERFEAAFPYTETPDQLQAIIDTKNDMERPVPMERLVCGDVGFGKTEVAFRAAFKAIDYGKQVVMLAPTTILAKQHYENAIERFKDFPVNIRMMSRLVPQSLQEETKRSLKIGGIDLVIGTHRVLSQDIEFKDLGLVIIDEEHRFGVENKERLKEFKTNVDVLSMSATPIPRTLQMSIVGARDMTLLETPPQNRYPIQTYVVEEHDSIVRDSIERELARKGQVFLLHNKVQSIERMAAKIQRLVPDARVVFAHGQMPKAMLEDIIDDFVHKQYDVLVSTTIIETGIDIPNANTLLVQDADRMGLAQLYQLRGRVGRSDRIAYSYFMYPKKKVLTEVATKRLHTIKEFTELGSGFKIAMRDLAIRGAGDILGAKQSGFIDTVGFEMYTRMLKETLVEKGLQQKDDAQALPASKVGIGRDIELDIRVDAYIPDYYISDESVKVEVYKQLDKVVDEKSYLQIQDQFADRFGELPEAVEELILCFYLRNLAKQTDVTMISQTRNKVQMQFSKPASGKLDRHALHFLAKNLKNKLEIEYTGVGMLKLSVATMKQKPKEWLHVACVALEHIKKMQRGGN